MADAPANTSWHNQPPYSPSSNGGQDGLWFQGNTGESEDSANTGEQNASWYPPNPPSYTPSQNGQLNGSWFSGQGSGGEGGNGGAAPTNVNWIPLYGDAKGFAQFGRPLCVVSF